MQQRNPIINGFFFILLIFVLFQLFRIFSPFFEAFFWAAILAFAFYPLYVQLKRFLKHNTISALVTTACIFFIVIPPSYMILSNLVMQTVELSQQAISWVSGGGLESLLQTIQSYSWFQYFQEKILGSNILKQNVSNFILRITQSMGNIATLQLTVFTKNLVLIVLNILIVVILLFFFIRDGEKIHRFIYNLVPMEKKDKDALFMRVYDVFSGVIRGQFFTSMVQGILTGFMFFLLQLPAPFFFGFLTFIISTIPIMGASTVWVPFVLYLFITQQNTKAVILLVVGTFVISLCDNFLKPLLIGERTKLPVLLLFFGILGGLKAYGLTGIFLGPVFITVFFVLTKIYQDRYQRA